MGRIDLTPSRTGYIRMLRLIIRGTTNELERQWCINELQKAGVSIDE